MKKMQSNTVAPMHILLVEQNDQVRELFTTCFEDAGYTVCTTTEPVKALEMVRLKVPDVIFSSIVFYDMDGFELCRQLRAMPETVATLIVALTGYSENGIEERIAQAGFAKYLLKPVSIEILLSLLAALKKHKDINTVVMRRQSSAVDVRLPISDSALQ